MAEDQTTVRLITFRVGEETFVLDIMILRQIIAYSGSKPVPKAPDFVEGIVVLRNDVIPIIDVRKRFFPEAPPEGGDYPLVLITLSPAGLIGLKVDEVRRIITVDIDEILPAPAIATGLHGEYFIGIVRQDEEVHMLVDVESLLSNEERRYLEAADLTRFAR